MASWIPIPPESDFSLQNLPYGIFSAGSGDPRVGVAIGDYILDLKSLAEEGVFSSVPSLDASALAASVLNNYASQSKETHHAVRKLLQELLKEKTSLGPVLRDNAELKRKAVIPAEQATMHLPMTIGDYTDFSVGVHHVRNCIRLFGPADTKLAPNYVNLPIAYHGRASSVTVSGTPFHRPKGQFMDGGKLSFGPSKRLDFEVEFAALIGRGTHMGESIDVNRAEDHVFGFVLMNDWSARDIQSWESIPLGPFISKSFCTTVSPWVVTPEALAPFRTEQIDLGPKLAYLQQSEKLSVFDIDVRSSINVNERRYDLFQCNTRNVAYSVAQMLAHHTVGGCPMRTGDLVATGTLSGQTREEFGSFFEASENGKTAYEAVATSPDGGKISRYFVEDGDEVQFRAQAVKGDGSELGRVGFGMCRATVLPSTGV